VISVRRISIAIAIAIVLNLVVFAIGSAAGATWLANGQTVAWYLVIVATPVLAIPETFQTITPHLKPGAVVTDVA